MSQRGVRRSARAAKAVHRAEAIAREAARSEVRSRKTCRCECHAGSNPHPGELCICKRLAML